ncbi:MAG: OsmC family protein [Anaerolineales bacterium]
MIQTATVKWVDGFTYVGTEPAGHSVVISSGDGKSSVSPTDMVLLAVASCSAVDVVSILEKKRMPLSSLEIFASGERTAEHPRRFVSIHLEFRASGPGLTEQALARAIELSETKYCSVAASLRGAVDISTSYVISENERALAPAV